MQRLLLSFFVSFAVFCATAVTAQATTTDLISNGEFTDDLTAWSTLNIDTQNNLLDQYPVSGQFLTLGHINEIEAVRQEVTIPSDAGQATLSLYYRFFPEAADSGDYLRMTVGSISETISAADANTVNLWTEYSLDVSALAGQTVTVELLVKNNADNLTFADLDVVTLTTKAYAELRGTATDADGHILRNAEVRIKNHNKAVVWTGTTNKKGKFTATGLRGSSKAYKVHITKNDLGVSSNVRLAWDDLKTHTFILE